LDTEFVGSDDVVTVDVGVAVEFARFAASAK
jgi:hypothetical protein